MEYLHTEELALVAGMSQELFRQIQPLVTVYSGTGQPVVADLSPSTRAVFVWAQKHRWKGQDWPDVSIEAGNGPGRARHDHKGQARNGGSRPSLQSHDVSSHGLRIAPLLTLLFCNLLTFLHQKVNI